MPNWCYNTLQLESGKSVEDLIKPYLVYGEDGELEFDFDKVIPIPEDLKITASFGTQDKELQEKYETNRFKHGFENWYDFCVQKWGTKWRGGCGQLNEDGSSISFDTAWSPPIPVIEEIAKKLPDDDMLILNYIEEGEGYCGKYVAGNEGGVDEFYDNIKDAPESLKEELGWEPWEEEE